MCVWFSGPAIIFNHCKEKWIVVLIANNQAKLWVNRFWWERLSIGKPLWGYEEGEGVVCQSIVQEPVIGAIITISKWQVVVMTQIEGIKYTFWPVGVSGEGCGYGLLPSISECYSRPEF